MKSEDQNPPTGEKLKLASHKWRLLIEALASRALPITIARYGQFVISVPELALGVFIYLNKKPRPIRDSIFFSKFQKNLNCPKSHP